MAATDSLVRISELVQRLSAVGEKQRGMPIEADDWNLVVDVLRGILELDRGQEESVGVRLEESYARSEHEHLGAVSRAWLDADLQSTFGSSTSSIATHRALSEMSEKISSVSASVADLVERIDELQRQVDRYAVNDLDRKRFVTGFEDRFASIEALGTTVTRVNSDFDGLRSNLDEVLELRGSLLDAQGNGIDVSALRSDVANLQELTANLDGIDGAPVRLRDVELRLQEISDAVGLGTEGLEGRLAALSTDLEARLETRSNERSTELEASLTAAQEERAQGLKGELDASLAEATSQLAAESETRVTAAEDRLQSTLETRLREESDSIRGEQTELAQALVGQQGEELRAEITSAVAGSRNEVEATLRATVIDPLGAQLTDDLEALGARLEGEIASASSRIDGAAADLQERFGQDLSAAMVELRGEADDSLQAGLSEFEARLTAQVSSDVETSLAGLRQDVDAGLDRVRTDLTRDLTGNLEASIANLRHEFNDGLNDNRDVLAADLNRSFDEKLSAARRDFDSKLAGARTDLTRNFQAELSTAKRRIDADIATLKQRRPGGQVILNPNRPSRPTG